MAHAAYANDIFQIFGGFLHMHSLFDKLGSRISIFQTEELNPLICVLLLGFLGQVRKMTFSKITSAAYRKRVDPCVMVFLTDSSDA